MVVTLESIGELRKKKPEILFVLLSHLEFIILIYLILRVSRILFLIVYQTFVNYLCLF